MKKARKLITFILTVVMVMSMSMNVWAAGEGSITITNAKKDTTYSVYKILELVSFDEEENRFSYRVTDEKWKTFLTQQCADWILVTDNYVTWIGNEEDKVTFAKEALAYAQDQNNNISATTTKTATDDGSLNIAGLDLGYYLVDSSMGTLCSLDTTTPNVDITEKNEQPTINKEVLVSSDPDAWDEDGNTAFMGDVVTFKVTIAAQTGAQNYVLHDTMVSGLSFDNTSVKVTDEVSGILQKDTHYTLTTSGSDGCTFEIVFNSTYLDTITTNRNIEVTYSATLTEGATIGSTGNANTARLEYGEKPLVDDDDDPDTPEVPGDTPTTTPSETVTKTYSFDLVKTDSDNKLLAGAEFVLYKDAVSDENKITLRKVDANNYVVDTLDANATISVTNGKVTITGLAGGTYFLEETDTPQGYNPLTAPKEITIDDSKILTATINGDVYTSGGVQVINNTGSELPSTGGIGTTIFYIAGGALVLFAVVLLVTKKRMKDEEHA